MTVERFLHTIDGISTWVGKAAAWLIIALMAVVCLEVFKRYLLNAPTAWIFDLDNMLYGSLFMLCGAYALAQNAHVRGDFLYSSMRPRTQALLDLVLYFVFFFPGIGALLYAGWEYAGDSWRIGEHSNVTADGPPVYHFKTVIPIAGALVLLQGFAEVVRCIVCLDRRLAVATEGRGRDRRRRGAARPQRVCRRRRSPSCDRQGGADRGGRAATRRWARETTRYERSRPRPPDADPDRGRDHDGLRHGLHPDGAGHRLRLHRLLRSRPAVGGQQGVRPDGPAHLRRHDQRRADLHPAVRADGLRDGARRAGRQDVLFHPARLPPRAGGARRGDAGGLHLLGHRQRPGRRGRGADGRHRLQPDAARGLRREARRGRDHRRRHARHPDPALGDDHRLRRGGRPVGGQALRRGDVPGLLPGLSLPRLHHGLGDDQSAHRTAAAGGADARASARLGRAPAGGLFAQRAGRPGQGAVRAGPRAHAGGRRQAARLPRHPGQFRHRAGAARAGRGHHGRPLVVRGDPQEIHRRARGGRTAAAGRRCRPGRGRRRRARPRPSTSGSPPSPCSGCWRRCATTGAWMRRASRC